MLGLRGAADLYVAPPAGSRGAGSDADGGGSQSRGLSGGELKRLTIAVEM